MENPPLWVTKESRDLDVRNSRNVARNFIRLTSHSELSFQDPWWIMDSTPMVRGTNKSSRRFWKAAPSFCRYFLMRSMRKQEIEDCMLYYVSAHWTSSIDTCVCTSNDICIARNFMLVSRYPWTAVGAKWTIKKTKTEQWDNWINNLQFEIRGIITCTQADVYLLLNSRGKVRRMNWQIHDEVMQDLHFKHPANANLDKIRNPVPDIDNQSFLWFQFPNDGLVRGAHLLTVRCTAIVAMVDEVAGHDSGGKTTWMRCSTDDSPKLPNPSALRRGQVEQVKPTGQLREASATALQKQCHTAAKKCLWGWVVVDGRKQCTLLESGIFVPFVQFHHAVDWRQLDYEQAAPKGGIVHHRRHLSRRWVEELPTKSSDLPFNSLGGHFTSGEENKGSTGVEPRAVGRTVGPGRKRRTIGPWGALPC